VNNLRQNSA